MKKIFPLLLSLALLVTGIPSGVIASELDSQTAAAAEVEAKTMVNDADEIKAINPEITVKEVNSLQELEDYDGYTFTCEQTKINYTGVTVTIPYMSSIAFFKGADKVDIEGTMSYDGTITQQVKKTVKINSSTSSTIKINFPTYGRFQVKATFYKGSEVVATKTNRVDIIAEEYNIAPVNATFPVIYLTLNLWDITYNEEGEPIPTFVMLNRTEAYNWDELPENVYGQPNLTQAQLRKRGDFNNKADKMAAYVKELVEISPDAKFNLYLNDCFPKLILKILVANGIPEDQYKVYLMSDGSGSYSHFNDVFNVEDAEPQYEKMAAGWHAAKAYAKANGALKTSLMPDYSSSNYAYVAANEEDNVEWWLARTNGTLSIPDTEFLNGVLANPSVVVKNITDMLKNLEAKGEDTVEEFKALYNFNDAMFNDAEKQGKKVMMILGSRTTNETNFMEYATFVMEHYGDDYVYYYKGHPATPTGLHPEKQKELDALNIIDVESSIPAELILFFYPDIYMAGYRSSTYLSVESEEMACGLFDCDKATGLNESYGNLMDFFISPISESSPAEIIDLCNPEHSNFLVEFSDNYIKEIKGEYNVAIYDYTEGLTFYYKVDDQGNYEVVKVNLPKMESISSTLSMKNKTLTLNFDGVDSATGYQIQYKTRYDNNWKTTTTKTNSKVFKDLKNGQTFEFRIRAYKTLQGKNYYGEWSDTYYRYAATNKLSTTLSFTNKTLTVKYNKINASYGDISYQIAYRKTSDGPWSYINTSSVSKTLKDLKTRDIYEVRVRPIKTINGAKYVGAYSNISRRYVSATSISSLSTNSGAITVNVKKFEKATGYEIVYSTSKDFTSKTTNSFKVKGASKTSNKISKLTSGKKYYVKVRTYKIIDGKTYIGAYSSVKSITVK